MLERFQKEWIRLGKKADGHYTVLILAAFFIIRYFGRSYGLPVGTALLFLIFAFAIGYWILVAVRAYQGKK